MDKIKIPFSEFTFSFARGSGPGGQNVNKVNTKVTLSWNPDQTTACSVAVIERFKRKFPQYILDDGTVQIVGQASRSQKTNMEDCVKRLHEMLQSVAIPPKIRKATKPKWSAVMKRLQTKRKDAEKKRQRRSGHE